MSSDFHEMFSDAPDAMADEGPDDPKALTDQPLAATGIGPFLRSLRGDLSLRQLQEQTGIAYSYLSDIERGNKRPGKRVLSRLAIHHGVPLHHLLDIAGIPQQENPQTQLSTTDVRRSFRFVMDDPDLMGYHRPTDDLPIDAQRLVVQLYEHFTGKKLLD